MKTATPKTYYEYRDKIRTGDLLLFHSTDLVSRIISWKTKSKATHASMAFWMLGPTGKERLYILESVAFGLFPTYLSNRVAWYMPHGDIYWHKIIKSLRDRGPEAADKLLDYVGTYYDYKDLILQAFKRVTLDPAAIYCSEAVAFAWKDILQLAEGFIVPYPGQLAGGSLGAYEKEGVKIT